MVLGTAFPSAGEGGWGEGDQSTPFPRAAEGGRGEGAPEGLMDGTWKYRGGRADRRHVEGLQREG